MYVSFGRRAVVFFGSPIRLPGFGTLALGAYALIPDTQSRLEFWRKVAGPLMGPYLASPWTGIAIIAVGLAWLWFFRGVVHIHHGELKTATTPEPTLGIEVKKAAPAHDTWLQDAFCVVIHGHWERNKNEAFEGEDAFVDISNACQALREAAGNGKLIIWGKQHPQRLYEAISTNFWINNQIDGLSVYGNPDNLKTEQITGRQGIDPKYQALKVNKAQVEAVWPPS